MDSTKFFPSRWLKAEDVGDKTVKARISAVESDEIGGDEKLVVSFEGFEKGLVLNKTNHDKIVSSFGTETETWIGKELELYTALVTYKNDEVKAIRVRVVLSPEAS